MHPLLEAANGSVVEIVPPCAPYATHASSFANVPPVDVNKVCHPFLWHSAAFAEFPPPAKAVATPTDNMSAATAAKKRDKQISVLPVTLAFALLCGRLNA
jgi:hypothetical protein